MLDEKERVLLRRMFGFPETVPSGGVATTHWRFYIDFGAFEFKMNNLSHDDVEKIRLHLAICKEEVCNIIGL